MTGEPNTTGTRRRLAALASVAVLAGSALLGACQMSSVGAPCSAGSIAQANGYVLRCKDGKFVKGESLVEFAKTLQAKLGEPPAEQCPEASDAGTDAMRPNCPSPCPDTSTDAARPTCPTPSPCPESTTDAYAPGCPEPSPCGDSTSAWVDSRQPGC